MAVEDASDPAGVPIGRAITVASGIANDHLRLAIDAIDRVHGDGSLPPTNVLLTNLSGDDRKRRRGRILFDWQTQIPTAILIAINESHRSFTLLHELGHLLDLWGIGDAGRFGSIDAPALREWRRAAGQSLAVRILRELSQQPEPRFTQADGDALPPGLDRALLANLLLIEEIWARSYAQYVAIRSANPILLRSLDSYRKRVPGGVYYPYQWDDADFVEIADAIEVLFRRLGWRVQRRP